MTRVLVSDYGEHRTVPSRSLIACPPSVTRTVCRTVLSAKTTPSRLKGAGGMFSGSVSCGLAAQVLIQLPVPRGFTITSGTTPLPNHAAS
jgi:hypothetical protein